MRDVVVAMVSDTWSDSIRRGFYSTADQTILSFIRAPSVGRVLVADHPRGLLSQVKRRTQGDRPAPSSGRLRGVRPLTVRTSTPETWSGIARRYRGYDIQLHAAARLHGLREPVLVTFNLLHAAHASGWSREPVFYAQDDETVIPRLNHYRDLIGRAYAKVDASPTRVVAVSQFLLDRIAPCNGGLVVPNGIDPSLWAQLPYSGTDPGGPGGSARLALYVGTVDARLDVDAFIQLRRAGFRVELIGPVADDSTAEALSPMTGIKLLGSVSRDEVVRRLAGADVCILAHRETELTSTMSPLKLFEYLVSGTPVVATDLAGVRDHRASAILVPPGGDYVAAAERAIAQGRLAETARRKLVDDLSWRTRHLDLMDLIR